jgi:O-antigen/teichoic acid export membrane protein
VGSYTWEEFNVSRTGEENFGWPHFEGIDVHGGYGTTYNRDTPNPLFGVIGGLFMGAMLAVFGESIISLWVGTSVQPPTGLVASFGVYVFLNSLVGAVAVVLNSSLLLRRQLWFLGLAAVFSFGLKILFCQFMGISGVVWATIVGFTAFFLIPGLVLIRKTFWRAEASRSTSS